MKADVNTPTKDYVTLEEDRKLLRRLMGGTKAMREASTDHLPKFEGEKANPDRYTARLANSYLTPFYTDAIATILGRIFSKPLIVHEDAPPQVKDFWQRVDGRTHGDAWVYKVAESAVAEGGDAILIDAPLPFQASNRDEEKRAGGGPRFVHVRGVDLIEAEIGDGPALNRARIRYKRTIRKGDWEHDEQQHVKVLWRSGQPYTTGDIKVPPTSFAAWQEFIEVKNEKGKAWVPTEISPQPRPFQPPASAAEEIKGRFVDIPLVYFAPEPISLFRPKLVFKHLGQLCEQHWRRDSEHNQAVRDAENPGIYVSGLTREQFKEANGNTDVILGGGANFLGGGLGNPPEVGYFETTGKALEHGGKSIDKIEARIRLAALMPMLERPSGSEIATLRILDEMEVKTKAQVWALSFQSALCEAVGWAAAWMGLEVPADVVRIPEESLRSLRPAGMFGELLKLAEVLVELPEPVQEVVLDEAKRYGILSEDRDIREILAALASTGEGR